MRLAELCKEVAKGLIDAADQLPMPVDVVRGYIPRDDTAKVSTGSVRLIVAPAALESVQETRSHQLKTFTILVAALSKLPEGTATGTTDDGDLTAVDDLVAFSEALQAVFIDTDGMPVIVTTASRQYVAESAVFDPVYEPEKLLKGIYQSILRVEFTMTDGRC